jgi:hypothetical protein
VYTGSNFASARDDHQWYLEDYQKGQGLVFLQITIACLTQYAGAAYVRHEKE